MGGGGGQVVHLKVLVLRQNKFQPSEMTSLSNCRWQNVENDQIDPHITEIWST